MKLYFSILLSALVFSQTLQAQKKLPVIKATTTQVDIKEDGELKKNAWRIVPEEKLDVYVTSARKITFYTNTDSFTVKINPEVGKYDFIILLNGKDTARTQIKFQPSHLEILQKAGKYNLADNRAVPKFTYQPSDAPELVKITLGTQPRKA
jgi:hypothetical protein